ncbi:hypothetical protein WJX81_005329 [Elliptochloris bilobata]|uniref:BZIP domain-containing protein n=1 Tax=Elliptochloris bilobata TaxID=381761 RepID=A0AAW1S8V8_9CHLO
MLPPKQHILFDQALLGGLNESDSMFAFLDQMVPAPEPANNMMLYGAAANLGDAALAGAVRDPMAWGGGLTPAHKAERLHLAREKNKEAQKAFRRRQKAKQAEIEKRMVDLAAQLEALQHENKTLHRQNQTLQSALVVRSSEGVLQAAPRPAKDASVSPSGQAAWLPWNGRGSMREMATTLVEAQVGRLAAPARVAPVTGSWQPWADRGGKPSAMAALVLTLGEGVERFRLTPEGARGFTMEGMRAIWKELVKRCAGHLVNAANDATGRAAQEIEGLTREFVGLSNYLAVNNPRLINDLHFQSAEKTEPQLPPNASLWSSILLSLRFTDEQKAELLRARRTYFMRVGPLLQERATIQSCLLVVDERLAGSSVDDLQLNELSEALQRNLQNMHYAKCLFMMRAWYQVLTPMQVATFIVHAYPRPPDMMAVCAVLAEQAGELPVSALLRAPKPREVPVLGSSPNLEPPCTGSIFDVETHPASPPAS